MNDKLKPEVSVEIVEHGERTVKPKRKCSEKQLAALAAGRAKNQRFKPKITTASTQPTS